MKTLMGYQRVFAGKRLTTLMALIGIFGRVSGNNMRLQAILPSKGLGTLSAVKVTLALSAALWDGHFGDRGVFHHNMATEGVIVTELEATLRTEDALRLQWHRRWDWNSCRWIGYVIDWSRHR